MYLFISCVNIYQKHSLSRAEKKKHSIDLNIRMCIVHFNVDLLHADIEKCKIYKQNRSNDVRSSLYFTHKCTPILYIQCQNIYIQLESFIVCFSMPFHLIVVNDINVIGKPNHAHTFQPIIHGRMCVAVHYHCLILLPNDWSKPNMCIL